MLIVFFCLALVIAVTRLFELSISNRHRARLSQRGATSVSEPGFPLMVALHVGVLAAAAVEALFFETPVPSGVRVPAAVAVVLANALRVWAIHSLGEHWNVRVVDSTPLGVISHGPYRWIRHPNYVAVFVELTFLPLVGGAVLTCVVGALLHVLVLKRRIQLEEATLLNDVEYQRTMGSKPRFFPG